MATSKNLNGLQPSRMRGGGYNTSGMNEYDIANSNNVDIFQGDVVKIVNGAIQKYQLLAIYRLEFYGC